jgi:fatty-acyl-CoA synthase
VSVRIVDEQGVTVADAQEGYVWIHGKTLTSGYLNGVDADLFKPDGWFDTGDLGFMWDEELFISGRAKDLIIRGGVNTSPQQIEWAVEEFMALRAGQVAAFSVIYHGRSTEEVVVLIGRHIDRTKEIEIRSSIARVVAEKIGMQVDRIVFTASGRLPKTTSGKLQRGLAKQMFLDGHFLEKEMEQ